MSEIRHEPKPILPDATRQEPEAAETVSEPLTEGHRHPHNWKRITAWTGGLLLAAGAYGAGSYVAYEASKEDVAASRQHEINYLARMCGKLTSMLPSNLHVKVAEGTPVYQTPEKFAERKLIFNLQGNSAGAVSEGHDRFVNDPLIFKNGDNRQWAGAKVITGSQRSVRMLNDSICDSPNPVRQRVAEDLVWIDLSGGLKNGDVTAIPAFASPEVDSVYVNKGELFNDAGSQIAVSREFPESTVEYLEQYLGGAGPGGK